MTATKRVIMIDNYDSFTWNIYEYLCQEGAQVDVYRNDAITIKEIERLNPDLILISPGPGHPKTDSGICRDVIEFFKGKLPIFGVCMGQQCIFEVFGGNVEFAGEIVHGKTSIINHDNKGFFKNVPQGVAVTRYHSLAGTKETLPDCLEVTSTTENGIIMGIRHKLYTIEGVQFHPESILTEEGHLMIRNILTVEGGYWDKNNNNETTTTTTTTTKSNVSILDKIYEQRKIDYNKIMSQPGQSFEDLTKYYELGLSPKVLNFYDKLNKIINLNKSSAIISEIKRASPSKGDIDLNANAALQGLKYSNSGVAAISVLTEPNWFKGSIKDLNLVRKIIDIDNKNEDRPCLLRKEFIFNKYQILEARLNGADTVLLIVKMLEQDNLIELFNYSKKLGMEPLVEINNKEELERALSIGSRVIGVNNRNLHDFKVDLNTTSKMYDLIPIEKRSQVILLALSGISNPQDVKSYKDQGIHGFLIGESLMRKGDKVGEFITELLNV